MKPSERAKWILDGNIHALPLVSWSGGCEGEDNLQGICRAYLRLREAAKVVVRSPLGASWRSQLLEALDSLADALEETEE